MISFKSWLVEMAMVSRQTLYVDDADIAYLKQFPYGGIWKKAFKLRYNDLIFKAIGSSGEVRPDWNDNQDITIYLKQKPSTFHVDTGISQLIEKLKGLGYDLTGTNSDNRESLFYRPMQTATADVIITALAKTIPREEIEQYNHYIKKGIDFKELNKILTPAVNQIRFSPNHNQTKRNDPGPGEEGTQELRDLFVELRPQIIDAIDRAIEYWSANKNPNVVYWLQDENKEKLIENLYNYVWLNWKDEKFRNMSKLHLYLTNKLRAIMQSGLISRRNHETLKNMGLNIHSLFSKINPSTGQNWTINDIKQVLAKNPDHQQRFNIFNQQTVSKPS